MNERNENARARGKSEGLACGGVIVNLWHERFIGVTALVCTHLSATVYIYIVYVNLDFFCNYKSLSD